MKLRNVDDVDAKKKFANKLRNELRLCEARITEKSLKQEKIAP